VCADEAVAHSIEHSFAEYEQRARVIQGALLAQSGNPRRGIEIMRSAMAAMEHTDSLSRRTLYLGHCAQAHARLGEAELALGLLGEAMQIADKTNEGFFEAELYRLRGVILQTLGRKGEAEASLRRAMTIAQQQQARWWELRAATSLAEHLRTRLSRLVAALARKSLRMVGLRRRRLSGDRRGGRKSVWGQNADERMAPETQLLVARPGGRDRRACPGCAARIGRSGR
jgi:tetratricopeptide (TPR) repeat protein